MTEQAGGGEHVDGQPSESHRGESARSAGGDREKECGGQTHVGQDEQPDRRAGPHGGEHAAEQDPAAEAGRMSEVWQWYVQREQPAANGLTDLEQEAHRTQVTAEHFAEQEREQQRHDEPERDSRCHLLCAHGMGDAQEWVDDGQPGDGRSPRHADEIEARRVGIVVPHREQALVERVGSSPRVAFEQRDESRVVMGELVVAPRSAERGPQHEYECRELSEPPNHDGYTRIAWGTCRHDCSHSPQPTQCSGCTVGCS